jgi:hypothetical protein
MADEAHVGFVDAHAEGDRRHHDNAFIGNELVLVRVARAAVVSGVVSECAEPGGAQLPGKLIGLLARRAIDDA